MNWEFLLPVKIVFGCGEAENIGTQLEKAGCVRGVLVCDGIFAKNGLAEKTAELSGGRIKAIFSDITPNPTVENVDNCVAVLRKNNADFAVALGGGSSIDCAKAACAVFGGTGSIREYHTGGKALCESEMIPLIAIPTTAGTGSEVTSVAVLTDNEKHIKAPLGNPLLYPKISIIDPLLTLSVPQRVTASTGLDALSHALEGFWSIHHQPICDSLALRASQLVFEYLPSVYANPSDAAAREKMSEAALLAGIAFSHPKTTVCHACSFPLTNLYGIPHGEACAFTLSQAARINAESENGRLNSFAKDCGFTDAYALADRIDEMKKQMGMRVSLAEIGVQPEDIRTLSEKCLHPNILNNPVPMDAKAVEKMLTAIG